MFNSFKETINSIVSTTSRLFRGTAKTVGHTYDQARKDGATGVALLTGDYLAILLVPYLLTSQLLFHPQLWGPQENYEGDDAPFPIQLFYFLIALEIMRYSSASIRRVLGCVVDAWVADTPLDTRRFYYKAHPEELLDSSGKPKFKVKYKHPLSLQYWSVPNRVIFSRVYSVIPPVLLYEYIIAESTSNNIGFTPTLYTQQIAQVYGSAVQTMVLIYFCLHFWNAHAERFSVPFDVLTSDKNFVQFLVEVLKGKIKLDKSYWSQVKKNADKVGPFLTLFSGMSLLTGACCAIIFANYILNNLDEFYSFSFGNTAVLVSSISKALIFEEILFDFVTGGSRYGQYFDLCKKIFQKGIRSLNWREFGALLIAPLYIAFAILFVVLYPSIATAMFIEDLSTVPLAIAILAVAFSAANFGYPLAVRLMYLFDVSPSREQLKQYFSDNQIRGRDRVQSLVVDEIEMNASAVIIEMENQEDQVVSTEPKLCVNLLPNFYDSLSTQENERAIALERTAITLLKDNTPIDLNSLRKYVKSKICKPSR